jgi:hypothetical protein
MRGIFEASRHLGRLIQNHRMSESNGQLSRHASQIVSEEPIGHSPVEYGRCNASVRPPHVTFDRRVQVEFGHNRIIGPGRKA